MKKWTLRERVLKRGYYSTEPNEQVRAELQRVARQVRKLRENRSHMQCDYTWALKDVLALIKEATR